MTSNSTNGIPLIDLDEIIALKSRLTSLLGDVCLVALKVEKKVVKLYLFEL